MKFKKLICAFLVSIVLVSICPVIAKSPQNWQTEYASWLLSQEIGLASVSVILLSDLDMDGVPELFWGYEKMGASPMTDAWTYKNNKMTRISIKNYDEIIFCVSNIKQVKRYRNKSTGEFLYLSPSIYTHNGICSYQWQPLRYKNNEIKVTKPVYSILTSSQNLQNIEYEEAWHFNEEEMTKDSFYKRLEQYLAGWEYIGNPTLSTEDINKNESDRIFIDSPSGDSAEWDRDGLQKFINSWVPTVVLGNITAMANETKVLLDKENRVLPSYMLFNNNYVRIRDLSSLLSGTKYQFGVTWDGYKVNITKDQPYDGVTIPPISKKSSIARYSFNTILLDDNPIVLTSYQIDGNNFVRLRDIASIIGFTVDWDQTTKTVVIK